MRRVVEEKTGASRPTVMDPVFSRTNDYRELPDAN